MQVFLANFASAPRWVFTRCCFTVGHRADGAGGAGGLALDVLKETGLAWHTKTGLRGIAMSTRVAPKADRTSTTIRCCGAFVTLSAFRGI